MKILVFGSINIDTTYQVDHIVAPGETIASSGCARSAGGKGANQSAALAKAGAQVYMAGKIGPEGSFLLDLLQSYGVNTDHVAVYDGPTGQAIIQLDRDKQNSILLFKGGNGEITTEEIDRALSSFEQGDLIILQNEIVHLKEIIEGAGKRGLKICLNPSPYTRDIESLPLDLVNTLFVNEIEGAAMAAPGAEQAPVKAEDFPAILDKLVGRFPHAEIVLTAGKAGAFYACGTERERAAIVDVPVVDTVGAGDTFSGYFIAARYCKGYPVKQALELASKAASLAVSRSGAMESVPLAHEVF
jgi:ribokinase